MKKEDRLFTKNINIKQLAYGMMAYTASSVFGPLLIFGGLGYLVDYFFDTKPIFIIIGVIVAFAVTNILIYKKINRLSKKLNKVSPEEDEKNNSHTEGSEATNDR